MGVPKPKSPKFQNVFLFGSMEKVGIHLHFSAATYDFFRNVPFCIVKEDTLHHIVLRGVAVKVEKQECFIKMAKKSKMCHFLH